MKPSAKESPSQIALRKRAKKIVNILAKEYADAECALIHENAYQLLVATVLSAQCTDERVNRVTPMLFERYPTIADLAAAKQQDVEQIIQSLGFFRVKAKHLREAAKILQEQHHGEVPQTLEELVELPGVGRKVANCVLGTAFDIPSGVVVDTHVKRITFRLGLTNCQNPTVIERELMDLLPEQDWIMYAHRVIHHGRRICTARKPNCPVCPLLKYCDRQGLPALKE